MLYWTEVSTTECRILRSDLAGNNKVTLHTFSDVTMIVGMDFDANEKRLAGQRLLGRILSKFHQTCRHQNFPIQIEKKSKKGYVKKRKEDFETANFAKT